MQNKNTFRESISRVNSALPLAYFAVTGVYTWVLIFRLPHTLRSVYNAYRPGGNGIADHDFWAFSQKDASFRSWYAKIAHDYHTQGRFGYAWDDGLGMPLGARIYNNFATYKLLYWLGTRRMMALGFVLMVLFCTLLVGWQINPWAGAIVGLLASGSPLLIGSYTHLGKPEVFWWGVAVPAVYVALSSNFPFLAGLFGAALAWLNLSVSVMLMLLIGPTLLLLLDGPALFLLLVGALPGAIKHGVRGIHMWRSGLLTSLTREQARLWKRPWYPISRELVWWFPFGLSVALSAFSSKQIIAGSALFVFGIALHWLNFRIIYLNDEQSFRLAFWVIGISYASVTESVLALFPLLFMAYVSPNFCGFPVVEPDVSSSNSNLWIRRLRRSRLQIQRFPALQPTSYCQPSQLKRFFERIPDGVRIMLESDGDPRTESRFRRFEEWMEHFLPTRKIDLVNEMYTRLVEPELMDGYLVKFTADLMSATEMRTLCCSLGVSYVLAHSSTTVQALNGVGFTSLGDVDLTELESFRESLAIPPVTLTLLANSENVSVIAPSVVSNQYRNEICWQAEAGQTYVVRYRYNPQFCASVADRELSVDPFEPWPDIPTKFMRVNVPVTGQVILKFRPRWI